MRAGNCIKLGGKSAPGHLITPLSLGKIHPVTVFIHLHGVNSYNARLYYPQVIHRKFQTLFRHLKSRNWKSSNDWKDMEFKILKISREDRHEHSLVVISLTVLQSWPCSYLFMLDS